MHTSLPAWDDVMVPNYPTPGLVLARGQGAHVWDVDGKQYLDLVAGVAVNVLGHSHPAVVAAARDQLGRLVHSSNLYGNEPALRLAARLQQITGGHKALLVNSGTEANEAAVKLMRKKASDEGRHDAVVVAFEGSFHGRTTGALALTGQPKHRKGFDPLPGQIVHVPYNDVAAFEATLDAHDVVGVFAECVQGEGGVKPMASDLAAALRKLPTDTVLCIDEVQTGVARTGRFFAHEHDGLKPGLITMAKGLGGGLPIGAMLASPKLAETLGPGTHGCTFGGNPVAAAAALAVLDVVEQDELDARAARLGAAATKDLADAGHAARGRGLLMGVPLDGPRAGEVKAKLQQQGILVGVAGTDVVRLAPPLIVDEAAWLDAMAALAKAIHA